MTEPLATTETETEAQHRQVMLGQPTTQRDEFEVFYTREIRVISVYLMHLGATPYEAADTAHEAIAKLLPDQWRWLEHPSAWLRVTAWGALAMLPASDGLPDGLWSPARPHGLGPG